MSAVVGRTVTLGPLSIPVWLLLGLASYAIAWLMVRFFVRREIRTSVIDAASTALLFFMLAWKLTPIVSEMKAVLDSPMLILYAPGGTTGVIAGIAAAGIYLGVRLYRKRKQEPLRPTIIALSLFVAVFALTFLAGGLIASATGDNGGGFGVAFEATDGDDAEVRAPDFVLTDLDGNEHRLSDYRGSTVVLNFWASWCPPCRAELPILSRFADSVAQEVTPKSGGAGNRGVILLGINQTASETSVRELRRFVSENELSYPVLLDRNNAVFSRYGVRGIPTTYVVGPDGTVTAKRVGVVTGEWLSRMTD